ncbi:MAG: hypothetical protein L6R41_003784 [Letrouitia leprolyta]|nr:MAG: hypothetical protein L6R41_003784 [Letrouitia leprolyta]
MDTNNTDLETFRRQWQEEVTARFRAKEQPSSKGKDHTSGEKLDVPTEKVVLPPSDVPKEEAEAIDGISTQAYHDLDDKEDENRLATEGSAHHLDTQTSKEPKSALEHYEKAIEREDQGNLGDSLKLYRQAFRLDAGVDQIYKHKHFPPSNTKTKTANPNPSSAPVTVPNTAHHSLDGPSSLTAAQLIASFAHLPIPSAPPPTEGSPPPPCPIADVPLEILIEILLNTAIIDIAAFARLSLVCKRLAHLTATEDRIWERICHGHEYGFAAMHYNWAIGITGQPLPTTLQAFNLPPDDPLDISTLTLSHDVPFITIRPPSLLLSPTYPSYKQMFHSRPRIRFNGCYISTVNYHRPGASNAPSNATFTSPIHIVTYYRYLRFFRDGTCVSLLTTTEPAEVVHHLTKENIHSHHNRESMLPSAVMRHALRGRWRLSGSPDSESNSSKTKTTSEIEVEGDVDIETEGVDPKYMYKMHLTLRNAGRGTRNNKLVWKGFWSYNRLTDDWAAFALRNDRAFFWSRVKSYGMAW